MCALKDLSSRVFRTPCPDHSTRMVNVGFPARLGYGFEMVDTRDTRKSPINRKFTPNPFNRIFREFSAI